MTVVSFFERPASTDWEILPIPGLEGVSCPAWFRPEHLPWGVIVAVPPELMGEPGEPLPFSLFHLVHAVGLPWENLASVSIYGGEWQPAELWTAVAGQQLPVPGDPTQTQVLLATRGVSPGVPVTHAVQPLPEAAEAAPASPPAGKSPFRRLESDWNACQGMERQLAGLRQQLSGVLSRLGTLDRDLRPQERMAADRQQKDEWEDARRWIRDVSAKVHRCIKAHDIGITSAAGRRNLIRDRYEQAAVSVAAAGDLSSSLHEVEMYRKDLANLFNNMSSALQGANTNGIQRAQRVLSKIAAQVSEKRAKDRGRP